MCLRLHLRLQHGVRGNFRRGCARVRTRVVRVRQRQRKRERVGGVRCKLLWRLLMLLLLQQLLWQLLRLLE